MFSKTAENCIKAVMCITHAMNARTEGSISVSKSKLDVYSLLTLIHKRHVNMTDQLIKMS